MAAKRVSTVFSAFLLAAVVSPVFADSPSSLTSPFLKDPYLIYSGNVGEMDVVWQMEDTQECTIEWGVDTTYSMGSAQTTEYGTEHMHSYTITGLSPATKYCYQVSCAGTYLPGDFYSAPEEGASSVSLMVYGDTRTNYTVHDSVAALMVSQYEAQPEYQTLVLATGDLVVFGAEEVSWQNQFFRDDMTNMRQRMREVPFTSCLGNHELYESGYTGVDMDTPLFGMYFPYPYVDRRYWSFDYGPVHVTVVDQYPGDYDPYGPGLLWDAELAWIESDLSSTSKEWKLVVLHEPGWSNGAEHENNPDVQELLQPLCEEYGVQMVFAGHNHSYGRACKNGVHHITTGGGGAPLRTPKPGYPNVITAFMTYHFCMLDIDQDILSMIVVDWEGATIDSFTIDNSQTVNYLLGSVTLDGGPGSVEDVLIEAGSASDNPDCYGYYGMQLNPGVYDVTASLGGYTTQVYEDIEILAGTETTLDIVMYETSIDDADMGSVPGLEGATPNPFATSTSIGFGLARNGYARIEVYDLSGRLVETLMDGTITQGSHSVAFDGSALPSGLYVVRMTAGGSSDTERIVLIR